jgi:hypothetical protein
MVAMLSVIVVQVGIMKMKRNALQMKRRKTPVVWEEICLALSVEMKRMVTTK